LPAIERVEAARRHIGWDKVALSDDEVRLTEPGMELDLGGIGKEYAADRCATALQAAGLRHGWVNLAGDIRVLGPRTDGSAWQFGIQHPRDSAALLATLPLADGALATSGDYERFIEHDGRRYCHILDARSGWPVGHWRSVSVVAPSCTAAGALTTLAMLMGPEAIELLRGQGVAFLAMDADGRVFRSE
jgi:thiamine biosynthesis lipoprotein